MVVPPVLPPDQDAVTPGQVAIARLIVGVSCKLDAPTILFLNRLVAIIRTYFNLHSPPLLYHALAICWDKGLFKEGAPRVLEIINTQFLMMGDRLLDLGSLEIRTVPNGGLKVESSVAIDVAAVRELAQSLGSELFY